MGSIFDHMSWVRVAVVAILAVAVGVGVASCFFPLFTRSNADDTTSAFYSWYYQYTTKLPDGTKSMTRLAPMKFDCPLARNLAITTAALVVASDVLGAVALFLSVGHLVYRPKFGCCMAIMGNALAAFLTMECAAVLSFYMYNYKTCLDSDVWDAFQDQNFTLGVGAFLTLAACLLFLFGAILETFS